MGVWKRGNWLLVDTDFHGTSFSYYDLHALIRFNISFHFEADSSFSFCLFMTIGLSRTGNR